MSERQNNVFFIHSSVEITTTSVLQANMRLCQFYFVIGISADQLKLNPGDLPLHGLIKLELQHGTFSFDLLGEV